MDNTPMIEIWNKAIARIRKDIDDQDWTLWLNTLKFEDWDGNALKVLAPHKFAQNQIVSRYQNLLERTLEDISGKKILLAINVGQAGPFSEETPPAELAPSAKIPKRISLLSPDYTFESFVIGENNSFAANAAIAISKNPGMTYNPCLIYGGVGLGKTHLIQAVGNSAHKRDEKLKIVYVTADNFISEWIQCIRDNSSHRFKNKYRFVDILLLDDIHFLQETESTQEELFHTFNALYESHKQMVFTCDRPVSELKQITDRLRNRFERGLNVDLMPPSYETRVAILKRKIEKRGMDLPDDAVEFICKNITTNVRDLEAALTKLCAFSELVNKKITLEIAQQQLKDHLSTTKQSNISADVIQRVVSNFFGVSHADLRSKKRTKAIAFPRQVAMYITREITEYSTTEIGSFFGDRDHTTVMYACQKIDEKTRSDAHFDLSVKNMIKEIKDITIRS